MWKSAVTVGPLLGPSLSDTASLENPPAGPEALKAPGVGDHGAREHGQRQRAPQRVGEGLGAQVREGRGTRGGQGPGVPSLQG